MTDTATQNETAARPAFPILAPGQVVQIPVGMLQPDPHQPRTTFDADALKALAADIKARGIELPIVVRGDYTIKDGERRWRAAKLAELAAVPCILAAPMSGENGAIDWLLDQAADNHHNEPLSALDWARVLRELVQSGIAVKDIPALLQRRGITMSRSYVSNLIRLNDLPGWAKEMIVKNVMPAAAGKYVLMTADYPPAMDKLRQSLEREVKGLAADQSLRGDLSHSVRYAFRATAPELTATYGDDMPHFPWRSSCQDCQKRSQVDGTQYCLDRVCFDAKQAGAEAAAKTTAADAGQGPAAKRKPDAREIAHKRQQRARSIARDRAIKQLIQTPVLKTPERRLIAKALVREMQNEHLRAVFASRGWEPRKKDFNNYYPVVDLAIDKMNDAAIDGLLLECALRGALTVGYYAGNVDHLNETAKRHKIDLKAFEKAALAELTKPPEKQPPRAKKKAAKKKAA